MTTVILGLLTTVAIGLFVVMLLAICVTHRSRRQAKATSTPLAVELIWSVIPWAILVAAVTPAVVGIMHDSQAIAVQARLLETGAN